jgi:hypothetical protein
MYRAFPQAVLAAIITPMIGCQAKVPIACQRQLAPDLFTPGLQPAENSYRLLIEPQSKGVFPCTLAIARVEPDESAAGDFLLAQAPTSEPALRLTVAEMSPAEQARWAEAFRGMLAIRDLRFLGPLSLKDRGNGTPGLLRSAARIDASFLLTYLVNRFGPNSAQVIGVLYDVGTARPVAVLHAYRQYLDEEGREIAVEAKPGDQRQIDAIYQATAQFEDLTVACMRELLRGDRPTEEKRPHRWRPRYPFWQPLWMAPPGMVPPL